MVRGAWWINLLLLVTLPVVRAELTGRDVVIVCNTNEPASRPLAEEYAHLRGVPTNQICALQCRVAETITRREFNADIRDPLRQFLTRPTNSVAVLVLMYGVPLRIEADPSLVESNFAGPKPMNRNEASVDSELVALPASGLPATGPLPNPFYRYGKNEFPMALRRQMLLVGRLDGPSPATVRRMMADAVAVERTGLLGRMYVDARGIREGGYAEGDTWLRAVATDLQEAGYDCELDDREPLLAEDFPMTDAAVYAGWYAGQMVGPMKREGFRFRPGAVAVHIHSSSAASLRTRTSYWAGPLLEQGAAATVGNVFEPYLSLTPHLDELFRRLLAGATFIEAAWASQPVASWQTTMVGDPLYRPFARSVDEQVAAGGAEVEWAYVRKVNVLVDRLDEALAEKLCREKAIALHSALLQEKLGDLFLAQKRAAGAIEALQLALTLPGVCVERVSVKLARAYEAGKKPAQALAVYEGLLAAQPKASAAAEWCRKARDLAEAAGQPDKAKQWQTRIDELLRKK
jgi:uncharacterized protein (TIGR03790 family)